MLHRHGAVVYQRPCGDVKRNHAPQDPWRPSGDLDDEDARRLGLGLGSPQVPHEDPEDCSNPSLVHPVALEDYRSDWDYPSTVAQPQAHQLGLGD